MTADPSSISVTVANRLTELERLAHIVDEFCAAHGLSEEMAYHINLALDEVISNVIVHGYTDAQDHEIVTRLTLEGAAMVIEITDDGRPFNPLDVPPVNFAGDPLARPVGGLGLHLVRSLMDSIEYRREDGKNVLVLRKVRC